MYYSFKKGGQHGYADVLQQYYKCEGDISIYHGNCNTQIPIDNDDLEYELRTEL